MPKYLIYDLPTRVFHILFSSLFVITFFITKTVDDESPIFSYHMIAGLILGSLVLLRVLWGFIGTRFARFSSFALHPIDLVNYLKGIFSGDKQKWIGHNPASSWGALVMLTCALMLAITGILMTSGYKETFEDVHELFANIFLITVLLHIAGVVLHAFRHQDGIALTMIHGRKEETDNSHEIVSSKPLTAITFILIIVLLTGHIVNNYNSNSKELILMGKTLNLGDQKYEKKDKHHEKDDD